MADNAAKVIGVEGDIPWLKLTMVFLVIYAVLTVLVMFYRPDFINVSVFGH